MLGDADGETLGDTLALGLSEGDSLGDTLGLNEGDTLGDTDALGDKDGLSDGDMDGDSLNDGGIFYSLYLTLLYADNGTVKSPSSIVVVEAAVNVVLERFNSAPEVDTAP